MAKTFEEVTEKIRESLLSEFDELGEKKSKNNLNENDLDFYLARDRKAAIVLKTLQLEMQHEIIVMKKGKLKNPETSKAKKAIQ
jgi:hypothetical protein